MTNAKIKWLSHAGFQITAESGKVIIIDPWFEGNPLAPCGVNDIDKADLVLVTHDHFDHAGNAAEIVKKTGATLIGNVETVNRLKESGVAAENIVYYGFGMNIGGTAEVNGISVTMTQAFHSSGTGVACGYIIKLENGFTIYHSGDTSIFRSMKTWGELYPLDLALLPIGGVFTMDPHQAVRAVKLLGAKKVIPMHYKTFPILLQDPAVFTEQLKKEVPEAEVIVLEPGQECTV
ncbi:MAG: metal-dependent hydrolase [Peptococcaceae bacterium]|nr:MAG: metal-dependent hydrolase [Peptococcaceae bacterium]